jgi:hypothetical protein
VEERAMGDGRGERVCAGLSALAVLLLVSPAATQRNIGVAPVPGGGGARFYTDSWAGLW